MPGRPRSLRRPQTTLVAFDPKDLPPAVKALPEPRQRAWVALAEGRRWREAAAAAGVPVNTVWRWAREPAFRDIAAAGCYQHLDRATDVIGDALASEDPQQAFRAAQHVHKALGIGVSQAGASPAARAPVQVNVTVDVLSSPLPAGASLAVPLDAAGALPVPDDALDAEWEPVDAVADGAPARSQASARRALGRDD